jgi:hypothetical protein
VAVCFVLPIRFRGVVLTVRNNISIKFLCRRPMTLKPLKLEVRYTCTSLEETGLKLFALSEVQWKKNSDSISEWILLNSRS